MVIDRIVPEKLEPRTDPLTTVLIDLNMCARADTNGPRLLARGGPPDDPVSPRRYNAIGSTVVCRAPIEMKLEGPSTSFAQQDI
jgi:hypothetical protein